MFDSKTPYQTILMTAGISIFGDRNHFDPQAHRLREIDDTSRWLDRMKELARKGYEPKKVSAEYSMLFALKTQKLLGSSPRIILIHTDTTKGTAAARLLHYLFKRDFNATVTLEAVRDIDVNDPRRLSRSLGNYMQIIGYYLEPSHPATTCLAPIGGYKVMTSMAYIAGSFFHFPTAYLHEDNQVLHRIPPVPIQIDAGFVKEHVSFLRRLLRDNAELPLKDLSYPERQVVADHAFLFERVTVDGEEFVALNALGHFIFSQPRYAPDFRSKIYFSREVMKVIAKREDYKRIAFRQCKILLEKLRHPHENWGVLHHEDAFDNLPKDIPFSLFKGSSGDELFRAAWRYDEASDALYVNYAWFGDHDKYVEDVKTRGTGLLKESSHFEDVTEEAYS